MIVAAHTHGAEENGAVGAARHVFEDALPKQQERGISLLVVAADKRAAQFESRTDVLEEFVVVVKERGRVEAGDAPYGQYVGGRCEPVSTGDAAGSGIPKNDVTV